MFLLKKTTRYPNYLGSGALFARLLRYCASFSVLLTLVRSDYAFGVIDYGIAINRMDNSGFIFLTPSGLADNPAVPGERTHNRTFPTQQSDHELEIRHPNGVLVAHHLIPSGEEPGNFQLQHYRGKPVFTWWQGKNYIGHGYGSYYISDTHFHIVKKFSLSDSQGGDMHEFRFLSDHIAAVSGYHRVVDGNVSILESVFSIVNIDTGTVVFNWHSLTNIPISASYAEHPEENSIPYDYFHINSISLAPDGNYLISSRNTSALYKIDAYNGAVLWTLGGKNSSFSIDSAAQFAFQHDAQFDTPHTIRIFNNNNDAPSGVRPSSIMWLHLDESTHRVSLAKKREYPGNLMVWAMGNAQKLTGGGVFGGWGTTGRIIGFNARGELIYDARLLYSTTYRAFYYSSLGS